MSQPKFPIPPEFQDQVRYIDSLDSRSDEDILTSLSQHQPVTSEKNIWAYWHSGIRKVPSWCMRNIISWVRINGQSWTVRVVDSVPDSPNNALKYLPATMLPESFVTGTMTGPYVGPHSADFLRGACLTLYGGVFLDVGIILINSIDKICWNHLSSPASQYNIAVPVMYGQTIGNHFVAARKEDPFIRRWHELFVTLWKDRKDYQGLIGNPLVAFAQQIASFDDSRASNFHWDFSVPAQTVFEYITQVICWQRLCMLEPPDGAIGEDTFNCSEYWQKQVLVFDVLKENWGGEELVGFSNFGQKAIDRLSVPLSANPDSQEYRDASAFVWRLLTRSSMQKVTHGKGLTNDVSLGTLLDKPENEDKDCAAGTFAELLRYGCVHFEQTRPEIELMQATPSKVIMKKGVLEP